MTCVAVVAHSGKSFGGGLPKLRQYLTDAGVTAPLWYEVPKSKKAPKKVRDALERGADLVLVWGGDGMVQRCIDTLAGSGATVGILPAGTANLLAGNLGIPTDLREAVDIALHGSRVRLDTATINGEHFAVMAGAGFDAAMIRDADHGLKDRLGRVAYLLTGAKNLPAETVAARIEVDGKRFFEGPTSCVLMANVGRLFGGVEAFEAARADDGQLEIGVVTAATYLQWARTLGRTAIGSAQNSPFVQTTSGYSIDIKFDEKVAYELDGGDREPTKRLHIEVEPGSITVCVPANAAGNPSEAATDAVGASAVVRPDPVPSAPASPDGGNV